MLAVREGTEIGWHVMTPVLRRRPCKDCSRLMVGYSQQWYCGECSRRRKQEADARSKVRQREPLVDISEAEVDARFAQALAEIRRSGVHRVDAESRSFAYRYQEP